MTRTPLSAYSTHELLSRQERARELSKRLMDLSVKAYRDGNLSLSDLYLGRSARLNELYWRCVLETVRRQRDTAVPRTTAARERYAMPNVYGGCYPFVE